MLRELTSDALDQAGRELDVYGYTKLPALLSPSLVERCLTLVRRYHDEAIAARGAAAHELYDGTRYVFHIHLRDRLFLELLTDHALKHLLIPRLNDPHYRALPAEVPNYYVGNYNARSSGEALALHIDSRMPAAGAPPWMMQVAFALEPHTIETGCTTVVPGSHRSGQFTDRALQHVTPLTAAPGDALLWDSRLWHGALPNRTTDTRWALIATLMAWWVKPTFDATRACPETFYQQLRDEQKALLGFCAIPPPALDGHPRLDTKCGYDFLKPTVAEYARL